MTIPGIDYSHFVRAIRCIDNGDLLQAKYEIACQLVMDGYLSIEDFDTVLKLPHSKWYEYLHPSVRMYEDTKEKPPSLDGG
jgi:hypothetical protein